VVCAWKESEKDVFLTMSRIASGKANPQQFELGCKAVTLKANKTEQVRIPFSPMPNVMP
jgi:hypothetical protein